MVISNGIGPVILPAGLRRHLVLTVPGCWKRGWEAGDG